MSTATARGPLRLRDLAPRVEGRIRAFDKRAARGGPGSETARSEARLLRLRLINIFATSYLPRSGEGLPLVARLSGFLDEHAEALGPELLDALAARLDPRTKEGTR